MMPSVTLAQAVGGGLISPPRQQSPPASTLLASERVSGCRPVWLIRRAKLATAFAFVAVPDLAIALATLQSSRSGLSAARHAFGIAQESQSAADAWLATTNWSASP
jgi:hypothetical protein